MNRESIVKITSSSNNGLGTGFVIDSDEKGVMIATCSHVVGNCNKESLLVDGVMATVKNDFKTIGLDLAILYVESLKREPFTIREQEPEKVRLYGYMYFNTPLIITT